MIKQRHWSYNKSFFPNLQEEAITPTNPHRIKEKLHGARSIRFHDEHKEENNIDPDDGNSWRCSACKVLIFSTPFQMEPRSSGDTLYRHDQCSNLPKEIGSSGLHPCAEPLMLQLQPNLQQETRCSKCNEVCGVELYRCHKRDCSFQLDLMCARVITIVHQSHNHRLMVIRLGANASFLCGACGTVHPTGLPATLVYVCNICVFWLHPHCATLPNAILIVDRHRHPLLLIYGLRRSCKCAICEEVVDNKLGIYFCPKCDFYVHIMCALTNKNNQSFEPVLLREARVPDLVHLPVPDEYTSIVRDILTNSATTTSHGQGKLQHQHPLTLHDDYPDHGNDDVDDEHHSWLPTCNACVQFISPPFYTCSQCPLLFLHDCCAHLPSVPSQNPLGEISLHLNGPNQSFMPVAKTSCCDRPTNGFTYLDKLPSRRAKFRMDAACALMPAAITHDAHSSTHILFSSYIYKAQAMEMCLCCGKLLRGVSYACGICSGFRIHATCARLPATVWTVYDPHPLLLVTAPPPHRPSQICEVCEQDLDDSRWYYGCSQCEQSFHVNCIPCLDGRSSINFRIARVRLRSHKCTLTLVRGEEIRGRRCGYCGKGYGNRDTLALECFECYYGIHARCADIIVGTNQKGKLITFPL